MQSPRRMVRPFSLEQQPVRLRQTQQRIPHPKHLAMAVPKMMAPLNNLHSSLAQHPPVLRRLDRQQERLSHPCNSDQRRLIRVLLLRRRHLNHPLSLDQRPRNHQHLDPFPRRRPNHPLSLDRPRRIHQHLDQSPRRRPNHPSSLARRAPTPQRQKSPSNSGRRLQLLHSPLVQLQVVAALV